MRAGAKRRKVRAERAAIHRMGGRKTLIHITVCRGQRLLTHSKTLLFASVKENMRIYFKRINGKSQWLF